MFEMHSTGKVRGDCTEPFKVILDKEYTVGEFVQTVLTRDEWGYICVSNKWKVFGNTECEYSHENLKVAFPDEILCKKVVAASADGGWSRMDYWLQIK